MLLTKQIDTIVKECHKAEVPYDDVLTVVKMFYNGRVPNTQHVIEALEAIYHITYDSQIEQSTKDRVASILSKLYP